MPARSVNAGRLARFDLESARIRTRRHCRARIQFHMRDDPKIDGLDIVRHRRMTFISRRMLRGAFGDRT